MNEEFRNNASPKKDRTWVAVLAVVVVLCVTTMFNVTMCSSAVSSLSPTATYSTALSGPTVGVIALDDAIDYNGTACSPEGLKMLLDEAADDANIVAVVLRVNSGGGAAAAGEEMATYLRQFKEATGKPVVVSSAATNASAAYEISSQADYIFTAKSTAIGSIGTAMQISDYSGLLGMLGIKTTDITSAESKDSTYGTRPLTSSEIEAYQHQVDQINENFIETVALGRNMTKDQVTALATGLTFTGVDAVENGLADEIGTLEDAIARAAALAGFDSYVTCDLALSSSDLGDVLETLLTSSSHTQSTDNQLKEYADVKSVHK